MIEKDTNLTPEEAVGNAADLFGSAPGIIRERKDPIALQAEMLFEKPCIISWSDGSKTMSIIGNVFYNDDAYERYLSYKKHGQAYPVEVNIVDPTDDPDTCIYPDDIDKERELCEYVSRMFTSALKQFVVDAGEPVYITMDGDPIDKDQIMDGQGAARGTL